MTANARRLAEFKEASGRYAPKRVVAMPPERAALIRLRYDQARKLGKARDEWRAKCETALARSTRAEKRAAQAERRLARAALIADTLDIMCVEIGDKRLGVVAAEIRKALR